MRLVSLVFPTCTSMFLSTREMLTVWGCPLAKFLWSMSMVKGSLRPPKLYRSCRVPEWNRVRQKDHVYWELNQHCSLPECRMHESVRVVHQFYTLTSLTSTAHSCAMAQGCREEHNLIWVTAKAKFAQRLQSKIRCGLRLLNSKNKHHQSCVSILAFMEWCLTKTPLYKLNNGTSESQSLMWNHVPEGDWV